jgi:hypothetical protein
MRVQQASPIPLMFFALTLLLLCLGPVGARLTRGSELAPVAAVRRRRQRLEANAPVHTTDVVWTILSFLCLVWFTATVTTLVRLVAAGGLSLGDFTIRGIAWWAYPMLTIIVLMKVLFGVLSALLPWTMLMGCWRRTRWGSDLQSFVDAEAVDEGSSRFTERQSQTFLIGLTVAMFVAAAYVLINRAW